ncbi:MAG: PTS sugar transporter subunit IIA [Elusimicrobiota bacterium]|jgi:PTS system nitrogen regulatory IIA component
MMALDWFQKKSGKKTAVPEAAPHAPAAFTDGVYIGKLLSEDLIVRLPAGKSKEQLIHILIEKLCKVRKLGDPAPYYKKVLEREQGMSTTLDTGLAVPHARIDGMETMSAVLGILPQGIPDPKQPDLVIRAMCIFFSPNRQEVFTQHLHLLRGVSALFQPAFIDELLKKASASEMLQMIAQREQAG